MLFIRALANGFCSSRVVISEQCLWSTLLPNALFVGVIPDRDDPRRLHSALTCIDSQPNPTQGHQQYQKSKAESHDLFLGNRVLSSIKTGFSEQCQDMGNTCAGT